MLITGLYHRYATLSSPFFVIFPIKAPKYGYDMSMDFWARVKTRIKAENTTQEWVASKVGVHGDSFRRWMSKKVIPVLSMRRKIVFQDFVHACG